MPLPVLRQLTLASLITLGLTACGGSDSGPNPSPSSSSAGQSSSAQADVEPAPFSFDAQTGVERGATVTSNVIEVLDISAAAPISVTGGSYSVNGGDYTKSAGEVREGDDVRVQLTAPEDFGAEASLTLMIGGVAGTFAVTTEEEDTTPDAFSFVPQEGLAPGTTAESGSVEITGINVPTSVSIAGGAYKVNGGALTTEASELLLGDTLTLEGTSPAIPGETQEVVVTVGGVSATFALTTEVDDTPPTAEFIFPTPKTATEGDALIIRGRADDDFGVQNVLITVTYGDTEQVVTTTEATSENDFEEWRANVDLGPGENMVEVTAEDLAGNISEVASVSVTQQEYTAAFPDDSIDLTESERMAFDPKRQKLYITRGLPSEADVLVDELNIETGEQKPLFYVSDWAGYRLHSPFGIHFDSSTDRVLVGAKVRREDDGGSGDGGIFAYDLGRKAFSILFLDTDYTGAEGRCITPYSVKASSKAARIAYFTCDNGTLVQFDLDRGEPVYLAPSAENEQRMEDAHSVYVDEGKNVAIIGGRETLHEVDLETGIASIYMTENMPEGTHELFIEDTFYHEGMDKLIVAEALFGEIWALDVESKEYTIISSQTVPNSVNKLGYPRALTPTPDQEVIFSLGYYGGAIWVVDVETGERVILVKPQGEIQFDE